MTKLVIKQDLPMNLWGASVVIPKGTEVIKVSSGSYAIKSKELLIKLTGNSHDPEYRYAWVPAEEVEQLQ